MKKITKEQLASQLNGRSYRNEITPEEEQLAKENRLVVIFGHSDDLVELRGAINDELGLDTFHLTKEGVLESECQEEDCPYFKRQLTAALNTGDAVKIIPRWGGEGMDTLAYSALGNPTWCFDCQQIDGKFATFDIFDEYDGNREYFCRGIVLDLAEVFPFKSSVAHVM